VKWKCKSVRNHSSQGILCEHWWTSTRLHNVESQSMVFLNTCYFHPVTYDSNDNKTPFWSDKSMLILHWPTAKSWLLLGDMRSHCHWMCIWSRKGDKVGQAVSRRLSVRVRSCGIFNGQTGIGTGWLPLSPLMLYTNHHPSPRADTIGQTAADVPGGLSLISCHERTNERTNKQTNKQTPWPLVRKQTLPTEWHPPVGKI
jgi:hypothetical protein